MKEKEFLEKLKEAFERVGIKEIAVDCDADYVEEVRVIVVTSDDKEIVFTDWGFDIFDINQKLKEM